MTFVSTLNPFVCFYWLTFTTGVTTYTLDQDRCGICQCKAMQSHLLRTFNVVLFHFNFFILFFFSVVMRLSRVQWTFKKLLWNFKVCMLKQTLAVFFNGTRGNYLLINQTSERKWKETCT